VEITTLHEFDENDRLSIPPVTHILLTLSNFVHISPWLGTNGVICDQWYRTDHDAGMPMPD
jgi:hypothetical protein